MSDIHNFEGFKDLSNMIEDCMKKNEDVINILEEGVREFTNDALKLPKPISKVRKAGYTHLIRCFSYRKKKKEIEMGWGKYYGSMVEHGTKNMDAVEHLHPLWEKNEEKYYKKMLTKLGL